MHSDFVEYIGRQNYSHRSLHAEYIIILYTLQYNIYACISIIYQLDMLRMYMHYIYNL